MLALLPDPQNRPTVLACDTSQQACSVALALADGNIIERLEETGRGHTEKLPLMIADILTKAPSRAVYLELVKLIDNYAASGVACPST